MQKKGTVFPRRKQLVPHESKLKNTKTFRVYHTWQFQ